MRWVRWIFGWIFLLVIIGGLGWVGLAYYQGAEEESELRLEQASYGNLIVHLEATGTIQPEEVIDVGAQVAGKVEEFGKDPGNETKRIDYGTRVEKGTTLAVLDAELFRSRLRLADSALLRARADTRVLQARQNQAEREWRRVQEVRGTRAVTDQEIDLARSNLEIAQAELLRGKAAEAEAEAQRAEAETNLGYTVIRSPVKGVIIDRRVNVGQTVVASLNAPSLFLIATDLTKMQVWVSVNEADIGQIRVGQPVTFGVDALPNEVFNGTVSQIRLNARMEQNVVSYIVVVSTSNPDLRLLPYFTANLKFLVNQRENVLIVPNAALRFKPPTHRVHPDYRAMLDAPPPNPLAKKTAEPRSDKTAPTGPAEKGNGGPAAQRPASRPVVTGMVWSPDSNGELIPIKVRLGITDGKRTEIQEVLEGTLTQETELVTGEIQTAKSTSGVNPFAPPPIFGKRSSSSKSGKK